MDSAWEFLGTLLLAVIAAFGAVALDRRFAIRDLRRDIYLEWLHLVDTQKHRFEEHQLEGTDQDRIVLQFKDDFVRVRNRLALLGADRVNKAIVLYEREAERIARDGIDGDHSPETIFDAVHNLPERGHMLAAMRRDIRGWWPRRSS